MLVLLRVTFQRNGHRLRKEAETYTYEGLRVLYHFLLMTAIPLVAVAVKVCLIKLPKTE